MKYYNIGNSFWEIFDNYLEAVEGYAMTEDEENLIDDIKHFITEKTEHEY